MSTPPKILVVDDLEDWRATMRGLLLDAHFDVQVAGSSTEAIKRLEAESFDLALLDMRLDERDESNTDGLELARLIQQRWPQTRRMIITGYDTPATTQAALEPDAQGRRLVENFVPKTDADRIVQLVREMLNAP
jgi:ATP-dependent Lon protease